jgi:type III pantothenate kinase
MCESECKRLLVADVGNTNVVFGIFRDHRLEASIRVETRRDRTAEEYHAMIVPLLQYRNIPWDQFGDFLISSVVPPAQRALSELGQILLGKAPRFVTSDMDVGVELRYHRPQEMGADRIVNAGYSYHRWKGCIVVDFGTATTFDVLSPDGAYLGGCIVPGVRISMEALFTRASRLPRIDVVRPDRAIGRSTEEAMQSGVYFGYVALVDGIVERIFAEAGFRGPVIATGGLASLVATDSKAIEIVEPDLALLGLEWLHQRQKG